MTDRINNRLDNGSELARRRAFLPSRGNESRTGTRSGRAIPVREKRGDPAFSVKVSRKWNHAKQGLMQRLAVYTALDAIPLGLVIDLMA